MIAATNTLDGGVFQDLKILDFTWVGVGPITTKYFADHGADVIRIESLSRPDVLRGAPPFKDASPGINRSQFSANYNTSKRGLGLNLTIEESRKIACRLITEWNPDVIAESFTPRVMRSWGLDYETVSKLRPDLVYFSTCQLGQTGPHSSYAGFGQLAGSMAGFYVLTGWPDREPSGPYGAYSDFLNPPMAFGAIVAALDHRDRTGVGQYLDLSQFEGATHFLAPHIMKYIEDGTIPSRVGNTDSDIAPHGIFRCMDENREFVGEGESWVAISVREECQWHALSALIGAEGDRRFDTEEGRRVNSAQLGLIIEAWTSKVGAQDAMVILQDMGIPAGAVQSQADLWQDPQLKHMDYFQWIPHPELGSMPYDGLQFKMSDTPGRLSRPQAMIGEHNEEVLRECLGLTGSEIQRLSESGALEHSVGMDT